MLLIAAALAGRCGPSWVAPDESCCNASCGMVVPREGNYGCILPHCGWGVRSAGGWRAILPRGMMTPYATDEAQLGVSYIATGPVAVAATADGRVRLSDFFALAGRIAVGGGSSGSLRLVANLPSNSNRSHVAVYAGPEFAEGWRGLGGATFVWALPFALHTFGSLEASGGHDGYRADATGGLRTSLYVRDLSLRASARLEHTAKGVAAFPVVGVEYAPKKWLMAADLEPGEHWRIGVRVGRWGHPDRYAE